MIHSLGLLLWGNSLVTHERSYEAKEDHTNDDDHEDGHTTARLVFDVRRCGDDVLVVWSENPFSLFGEEKPKDVTIDQCSDRDTEKADA